MQLTKRQQQIFDMFLDAPSEPRTISNFAELGPERTTIFRDIKKLVQADLLRQTGKSYRVNPDSDAYLHWDLSRAPYHREPVRYNPALLENYRPDSTFLLSDGQLLTLEKAGQVEGIMEAQEKGKLYDRVLVSLLIDLTHASSNLENVPISWLDTRTLIEFGERPDGLTEQQMRIVMNHKAAISYLREHASTLSLSRRDLFDIHSLIIDSLLGDVSAAGRLRTVVVRFDDSRYLPPDNPHQLNEVFEMFCEKVAAISNPYEQAFFTMAFIPYLQPFQDGNKRVSRIGMNIPLVKNALAPFSFADIRRRDYTFGLLAFYERGRHHFLAKAFTEAYGKSAGRYADLISYINDGGMPGTLS
ncbi:Fic family protein [Salmonella enterica]|nr:Fic family protein [Salmonella enterica]